MFRTKNLSSFRQHRSPPTAASISDATPSAGLAVMPEKESDPPQFSPTTSFEAGTSVRFSLAHSSISARIWRLRGFDRTLSAAALLQSHADQSARTRRQIPQIVRNLIRFAAKAQNNRRRNVRMRQRLRPASAEAE